MHAILHDTRLAGTAPASDFSLLVNGTSDLGGTLTRIRQYALSQTGRITLDIMCHGFETHTDVVNQRSTERGIGGGGLQLCRQTLRGANVGATAELENVVETITVYACSAAQTARGYSGSSHDGQAFFREMAHHTNATIYAADATQWYWHKSLKLPNMSASEIDFRKFEGNLYRFTPDGNVEVVESNQLEAH